MDSSRDSEFDARLKRIEAALADLQRSFDALASDRTSGPARERAMEQPASYQRSGATPPPAAPPHRRQTTPPSINSSVASLLSSHDAEWWLSRVGIGFLVLGVLLLYGYAVDHGWITPPVRVLAGTVLGGLLFWFAGRVRSESKTAPNADLGFRELLLGGALAIWYVTAYAAGVWYQLLPIPAVRLILFLLAVLSTWIALQENREIFALAAVATGFATPFILPAPVNTLAELSLYTGAVAAIGLIIYLLRGWQSILWITFAAFWMIVAETANAQAIGPSRTLDSFDSVTQWTTSPAAGVEITIHPDSDGIHGRTMRLDFDFHGNSGYAIVHRSLNLPLPPNYQFSFAIKGEAPSNILEFKLIDSTGANVWLSSKIGFVFPRAWQIVKVNKQEIHFGWGQPRDYDLKRVAALELAITAGTGGKGSVWLDDLAITPLSGRVASSVIAPQVGPIPFMRVRSAAVGSVAMTILLLIAAVAFTRTPLLRRELLRTGSPRYTSPPATERSKEFVKAMDSLSAAIGGGKTAPDSVVVWALMLASAYLAITLFGAIWTRVPDEMWGASFLVLGLGALLYSQRASHQDAEISHAALTAGVLWTLIGIARVAPTPENIPACALVTALIFNFPSGKFAGPCTVTKVLVALVLWIIAAHELSLVDTGLDHYRWIFSDVLTLGAATFISLRLIANGPEQMQGRILGVATYLTGLIVLWSALDPLWAPLVTASYALLGATLLILSQRDKARPMLKYLGGVTMIIVVARLLFVDLASVETIWRILLFLVCGAVFLYTAYQMQSGRAGPSRSD